MMHHQVALGVALALVAMLLTPQVSRADSPRPNIIHIFVDDLGKASVGVHGQNGRARNGQPHIRTPNIDALATGGMTFNRAYSATLCSPSRGMLYLGFNQAHNANDRNTVNPRAQDVTLADVLKQADYTTSVWGKWGFGGTGGTQTSGAKEDDLRINPAVNDVNGVPTAHGYDEFTGYINHSRAHRFFTSSLWTTDATGNPVTAGLSEQMLGNVGPGNTNLHANYTHDVIAARSEQFIEDHYQNDDPFFMQVNYTIPHNDLEAIQFVPGWFDDYDDLDTSTWTDKEKFYAAMITRMDSSIGSLIDKLDDPDGDGNSSDSVLDNTMIVFTSDNGATNADFSTGGLNHFGLLSNPWRGGKRDLWEGGINMPQFVRWDGVVQPGSTTDHLTDLTDFMATVADLAGVDAPVGIDGHSLAPLLTGEGIQRERDYLVFEHHEGDGPDPNGLDPRWAIIRGDYKLIEFSNNEQRLYNLATDPDENNQLDQDQPANAAIVAELTALALAEGVELPASYDHEYAVWTGTDGDTLTDAANWNASGTGAGGAPGDFWSAVVNNGLATESTIAADGDVTVLGLEVRGDGARQTVRVAGNVTVTGRNAVRLQSGGRIHLDGGTLRSNRWIDVHPGSELTGQGDIEGDLYNAGHVAPGLAADLVAPGGPVDPPEGVVTVVEFDFSGIQDGVANGFVGTTNGAPLTQTTTLESAATLTAGFQYGPGLFPRHTDKPGVSDVGDEYNIQGTNGASSLAGAITAQNYMTFAVTPVPGLELDVEQISFRLWRNGSGAADDFAILASTTGFSDGDQLGQLDFNGGGIGIANQTEFTVSEPGENFTSGPVEVRLYGWNNGGTNGNFHVNAASLTGTFRTMSGEGLALDPTGQLNLAGDFFHIAGGALAIEIGGTDNSNPLDQQYDVLAVDGAATLEGLLSIDFVAEDQTLFVPEVGQQFVVLTATDGVVGQFSSVTSAPLPGGLGWQVQYGPNAVTLEVVSTVLAGDFNSDGVVDAADYVVWRDNLGAADEANINNAGDGEGGVDAADYMVWRNNFGAVADAAVQTAPPVSAVPEPTSIALPIAGLLLLHQFAARSNDR